ncbi:hypothetical protein P9F83_19120 [Peribacillus psychrosaccharolyticus]|uniref:hypothetical protein n=1 Tax=Peribacillus psychrosaccharolyticus TaxID=1407 RepID=UPI0002D7143A|nr:hypothetical protein [Peribacillus psychrosaccharolyticus]MEC2057339.1 hypothetical protein [Peribacillus psychrosaccharolyticus]
MVTLDQLVPAGLVGPKNAKEVRNETIPNLFFLQTEDSLEGALFWLILICNRFHLKL